MGSYRCRRNQWDMGCGDAPGEAPHHRHETVLDLVYGADRGCTLGGYKLFVFSEMGNRSFQVVWVAPGARETSQKGGDGFRPQRSTIFGLPKKHV